MNKEQFFTSIQGKTVTFCGIGRSHMPLIRLFQEKGALVSARDKRSLEELGDNGKALQERGVQLILGENYLEDLREDIIFRTPGMKYHLPQLEAARKRGAAVTSEMEVFFQLCPCKIYAVTGSDGKTTTTSIIAELLKAQGKTVHLGGNIGKPLLPEIESIQPEDCAVVELSSFQLISMRESPDVAVVTNLSPNHLDVHKDMQEYIDAKKNILLHQGAFSRTVLNAGNEITASFAPQVRGDCWMFRRGGPVDRGVWRLSTSMARPCCPSAKSASPVGTTWKTTWPPSPPCGGTWSPRPSAAWRRPLPAWSTGRNSSGSCAA